MSVIQRGLGNGGYPSTTALHYTDLSFFSLVRSGSSAVLGVRVYALGKSVVTKYKATAKAKD